MGARSRGLSKAGRACLAGIIFFTICGQRAGLQAQVILNELLAENGTSIPDDDGDFEDWVELRNSGPLETSHRGYALSDDPAAPRKWNFPDVSIPPGGYLLVWLSGKNRFAPRPVVPGEKGSSAAFRPVFVQIRDEWRYWIADPAVAGPPDGWNHPGFDDASWLAGRSSPGSPGCNLASAAEFAW